MADTPLALVIEDDEDMVIVFTEAVRAAGYQAESFQTGEAALARLAQVTPALVILDLHLPGITGDKILDHIRADGRLQDVRVIVASADDRLADEVRAKASIVLLKPISLALLRDLARRIRPQ